MAATPADIAKFTSDGIVISAASPSIKTSHFDAEDKESSEIEMFFDSATDGQVLLDERFAILSKLNPLHEGIEVDENLGLGVTTPIAPTVPCFRVLDESRGVDVVARCRAFAYEMGADRYSVEVIE